MKWSLFGIFIYKEKKKTLLTYDNKNVNETNKTNKETNKNVTLALTKVSYPVGVPKVTFATQRY